MFRPRVIDPTSCMDMQSFPADHLYSTIEFNFPIFPTFIPELFFERGCLYSLSLWKSRESQW